MKVLMVTPKVDEQDSSSLGFIPTWINSLAKRVEKLHVVTFSYNEETQLPQNVVVHSLARKSGKLSKMLYFNNTMLRLLRKETDVMFCHMYPGLAIKAAPYAELLRVPVVWWRTHGSVSLTAKVVHFLANKIVTASEESFRIKSDKIIVTGHGIDTGTFKPALNQRREGGKITILSVGRISPIKNYETFIRAADILINERGMKNLEFLIVGGVPMVSQQIYYERLRKMVEELGLRNHLKFIGPVPHSEVVAYYQGCDLFVSASQTGSVDKIVLEAMSCEKPALACNEAFEDVFGDYSEILMFNKGDSSDLVKKISGILQMGKGQRSKLGTHLRMIVKKEHSIDHLMNKLIDVFEECK